MFRVIDCVLTSKNGKMTAVLTLSGTGYDYLCLGTKEEAAAADSSTWVPYVADANGKYTYEIPVEALDNGIAVAAFSHKNQIWYDRILTFQSSTLNKIGDVQILLLTQQSQQLLHPLQNQIKNRQQLLHQQQLQSQTRNRKRNPNTNLT